MSLSSTYSFVCVLLIIVFSLFGVFLSFSDDPLSKFSTHYSLLFPSFSVLCNLYHFLLASTCAFPMVPLVPLAIVRAVLLVPFLSSFSFLDFLHSILHCSYCQCHVFFSWTSALSSHCSRYFLLKFTRILMTK